MPRRPIFALPLVAAVAGAACEDKKTETATAAPPAVATPQGAAPSGAMPATAPAVAAAATGDKGTVKGTGGLTGKVPEMPEQKRQTDAFCGKSPQKDDKIDDGKGGPLAKRLGRINDLP